MTVRKRPLTLSNGRPPASRPKERMTSERSRTIIRTHHRLHKKHVAALKDGEIKTAQEIARLIKDNGGLELYQAASKQGQAKERGGDSSKVLVEWLRLSKLATKIHWPQNHPLPRPMKCLEIGALSAENEISKFPEIVHMTRIDLNSQGAGIEKQDFMERPLPLNHGERFDIISLSLVLNYVPDAVGRGEMLKRLTNFFRQSTEHAECVKSALPALFLVLPLPCVTNSRYLDEDLLLQIMNSFGYHMQQSKHTSKLCYYLFSCSATVSTARFQKKKVRDGPTMNNFSIVVK